MNYLIQPDGGNTCCDCPDRAGPCDDCEATCPPSTRPNSVDFDWSVSYCTDSSAGGFITQTGGVAGKPLSDTSGEDGDGYSSGNFGGVLPNCNLSFYQVVEERPGGPAGDNQIRPQFFLTWQDDAGPGFPAGWWFYCSMDVQTATNLYSFTDLASYCDGDYALYYLDASASIFASDIPFSFSFVVPDCPDAAICQTFPGPVDNDMVATIEGTLHP